jgi:hypothetical protein
MGMLMRAGSGILILAALAGLSGCIVRVSDALRMNPETVEARNLQSRKFVTADEKLILSAVVAVLQDLEFTLEESSSELGLVVASKDRSAVDTGQRAGAVFLALLGANMPTDRDQKFRASVVTRLTDDRSSVVVRVTFQRTVWNTQNQITHNEELDDPVFYQRFFERLSQAVFLEANEI